MLAPGFRAAASLYAPVQHYATIFVSGGDEHHIAWPAGNLLQVGLPALPIGGGGGECVTGCLPCKGCGQQCFNTCGGSFSRVCNCPTGNACCGWNPETGGGRCTDLSSDPQNCGSCFHSCPPGTSCSDFLCCPVGQTNCGGTCTTGSCQCPTGLTKCGGVCTDTSSDPQNCGICGGQCGGLSCCGGLCVDTNSDNSNCGGCGIQCGTFCVLGSCFEFVIGGDGD
jgi:hypothetical protein